MQHYQPLRALLSVALAAVLAGGCVPSQVASTPGAGTTAPNTAVTSTTGNTINLSASQIVSNNAGGLQASISGKIQVTGPASLISNNAGGLISNNAGGLISNNAGGYRISSATDSATASAPVARAVVYLTTPDERFYGNDKGQVFYTWTDDQGNYSFPIAPSDKSVIVTVLLSNNRRLVGFLTPSKGANTYNVDVSTTVVTEYMRSAAMLGGRTMDSLPGIKNQTLINEIASLTAPMIVNGSLPIKLSTTAAGSGFDLSVNAIPQALNSYMQAFGADTTQRQLSDDWKTLLGFRPLLIDEIDVGMDDGYLVTSLTAANGVIYAAARNSASVRITATPEDGASSQILADMRQALGINYINGMTASGSQLFVGAMGAGEFELDIPAARFAPVDCVVDWETGNATTSVAVTAFNGWPDNDNPWTAADVAFWGRRMLVSSDNTNQILGFDLDDMHLAQNQESIAGLPFDSTVAADSLLRWNGDASVTGAQMALNVPTSLAVHQDGGATYLYFADTENQRIRRTRLDAAGYPTETVLGRGTQLYGNIMHEASDATASLQAQIFDDPTGLPKEQVSLLYPHGLAFDAQGNLFFGDTNHRRVRMLDHATQKVVTVAGTFIGAPWTVGDARRSGLGDIYSIAFDSQGKNLLISDSLSKKVRRVRLPFGL